MKTSTFSPSTFEIPFANALKVLREEIQQHLLNIRLQKLKTILGRDTISDWKSQLDFTTKMFRDYSRLLTTDHSQLTLINTIPC